MLSDSLRGLGAPIGPAIAEWGGLLLNRNRPCIRLTSIWSRSGRHISWQLLGRVRDVAIIAQTEIWHWRCLSFGSSSRDDNTKLLNVQLLCRHLKQFVS